MWKMRHREATGLVLTSLGKLGTELDLTMSLQTSSPLPCYLYHTLSFCYSRHLKNICGREKQPLSQSCLFAEPNPSQGCFALQEVPHDWEISTHLGGHFLQIKGACKPQPKSRDTSKTIASHHGTQHLCSPTSEHVSLAGRQHRVV